MTLDGNIDHVVGIADEELHRHYTELINNAGVVLYGRITYQLMQFWKTLVENPSGERDMDDFAIAIDNVKKLVFSDTLKETGWESAFLAGRSPAEELQELLKHPGKDILIGSRSLIIQLIESGYIDELQLCIHPVIDGPGLQLFEGLRGRHMLILKGTKILNGGQIVLYYEKK